MTKSRSSRKPSPSSGLGSPKQNAVMTPSPPSPSWQQPLDSATLGRTARQTDSPKSVTSVESPSDRRRSPQSSGSNGLGGGINGHAQSVSLSSVSSGRASDVLAPSALPYFSNNLFNSLWNERSTSLPTNDDGNSSDLSEDSEMDDDYESSSSESSNTADEVEDSSSEEEAEDEDEEEEEEEDKKTDQDAEMQRQETHQGSMTTSTKSSRKRTKKQRQAMAKKTALLLQRHPQHEQEPFELAQPLQEKHKVQEIQPIELEIRQPASPRLPKLSLNTQDMHRTATATTTPTTATIATTPKVSSPPRSPRPGSPRSAHQHHQHHHDPGTTTSEQEASTTFSISRVDRMGIPLDNSASVGVVLLADESAKKKWANWSVRTLWTLIMIGGFFACVAAGPLFVILLVVMVQGLVYKEVINLAHVPSREKKLPWFRTMHWYFLFSTNYFFYGESLIHYCQHVVFVDAFLLPFATHHRFISFSLYVAGFVFFVANLKKGHYRFQFSQFAWTHMTLLLVVCQSHFIINNIFEGLIWFFLPVSLVIANDIWAYIFGFFWGRTPLIKLSPKKTVEGFVGGWIMTIFFGMLFATLFLRYPYMICPVKDLSATAFSGLTCEPNPVFVPEKYFLRPWMASLGGHIFGMKYNYVMIAPLQWHSMVMACFASLIAPFGGFFASGFKRAFKIKDFGQSIPGHGGITDRMDCQFIMGLFSYMYYQSFIKTSALSVGIVLQSAINNLKGSEQVELFDHMRQYLIGQGLLDESSCIVAPPKEAWASLT
ncbi:hypothetical protein BGW38_005565 [Lunasporangiospora selenospora]|uniref:Phosphatidate cytidylyltransferase n=1 Tax=Lunasporangiospora selenospora TaxID=979761 RepID=A0A9P6FZH6_9FUNG|nr:hypothetical protein BGW38_005565 [Lunasporangiospora selenospora]